MATGKPPPDPIEDIDELKNKVVSDIEKSNRGLLVSNCGIADIIARCIRYNKDQRIRDADALLDELRLFSSPDSRGAARHEAVRKCVVCLLGGKGVDNLFARMLNIDFAHIESRADDMKRGIMEVSGDHEDLVFGMSTYLSILGEKDTFLMKTTPRFWTTENMGVNGRFLSMIKFIAQRGTKVKHLMLVCESDRHNLEYKRILEAHQQAVLEAAHSSGRELECCCRVVSKNKRDRLIREGYWERCYAISGGEVKVIQPVYDKNDILRTVRFVRQKVTELEQVHRDKEFSGARRLSEWLGKEVFAQAVLHELRKEPQICKRVDEIALKLR